MQNNYQMERLFEVFQIQKADVKTMEEVLKSDLLNSVDKEKLEEILFSMKSLLGISKKALVIMNIDIVNNFLKNMGERSLNNDDLFETVIREALIPAVEEYDLNSSEKSFIVHALPYIGYSVAKWEKANASIATVNQSELERLEKYFLSEERNVEVDDELSNEIIDIIYEKGLRTKNQSITCFKKFRKK